MEFLLKGKDHGNHEEIWSVYSSHYNGLVCLGCMVETLENEELLPLQKKPSLTETLRLLTHQSSEIIQIFMAEEMVVWHFLTVLMGNLKSEEESFQAICTETILKLTQLIGSEDLVTSVVDNIAEQMEMSRDHNKMVPYYMLIGKLLYQLPGLANKLVLDYSSLIDKFGEDLCRCSEKVQSELAYIFILLFPAHTLMSPRLLGNLHMGTLGLLTTAQKEESQINGLGLLKKLIQDGSGCHALMFLKKDDHTVLSALKKLLLSKQHTLQIHVGQVLLQMLSHSDGDLYGKAVLDSDIAEFLFEGLHTSNTEQIHCIMKVLHKLACLDHFYKRCHAVYGIESVLRCLTTSAELRNPNLQEEGFHLITEILQRQSTDIPLFVSQAVVKTCLKVMLNGIEMKQLSVSIAAQKGFTAFLRKDYLLLPVPFTELGQCITSISTVLEERVKSVQRDTHRTHKVEAVKGKMMGLDELLNNFCDVMLKAAHLIQQCISDPTSLESSYLPPNTVMATTTTLATFTEQLLQILDEVFIPVVVVYWDDIKQPEIYWKFIQLFPVFQELNPLKSCDLMNKLVEVGFLGNIVDVTATHRDSLPGRYASGISRFLQLAVECFTERDGRDYSCQKPCLISQQHLRWPLSDLGKGLIHQDVKLEEIEAYLTVLYIFYRYDNRLLSNEDLSIILSSTVEVHTSLEQLSPFTKRNYLYLLAWLSTHSKFDMWTSIPNGMKCLPTILNGPIENWYTDDIIMLQWAYMDSILAPVCGQQMLSAYLGSTSLENMQERMEELTMDSDVFHQLFSNKHFTRDIVVGCSNSTEDIVRKLVILQTVLIDYCSQPTCISDCEANMDVDTMTVDTMCETGDHRKTSQLEEISSITMETLQNVFLKNYSKTQSHNIVALLDLYLKVYKYSSTEAGFNKKILYHVLNLMKDVSSQTVELQTVCLIAILAALSSKADSQALCMIVKQDHVLEYLESCLSDRCHSCYCLTCDILTDIIIQAGTVQVHRPIIINIVDLVEQLSGKTRDLGGLRLLTALFRCRLNSNVVDIEGNINKVFYKSLHLTLQQMILMDIEDGRAVECFLAMLSHLETTDQPFYSQLLTQPWNRVVLDGILDIALETGLRSHHVALYTFFTKDDHTCEVLSAVPGILSKLVICTTQKVNKDMASNEVPIVDRKKLISQILSSFEESLLMNEKELLKKCLQ